jgi:hypothetical protein
VKPLRWVAIIALVLIALDIALIKSPYMVLLHRQEISRGETIKTPEFGDVLNPNGGYVCTYWKGRSASTFIYPPTGCPVLTTPYRGMWIGK